MNVADVAAQIINVVQDHEGSPEELLRSVITEVDNWGQNEYEAALEDYGIIEFDKEQNYCD